MVSDAVRYYDEFLAERDWLAEGLSWAVVQPASAAATVDGVIERLRARRVQPGDDRSGEFADLVQIGPDVTVFQDNGCALSRPEVLRWLSDGTRVHTVEWTINGNGGLTYAVYGRVLTWMDLNDPERRHGDDPSAFAEDLDDVRAARGTEQARPAAMAFVERRTGVRLPAEWMSDEGADPEAGPWVTVRLGAIPSDPRPPSNFGHYEPDLDARLRAAPERVRREALALAVRAVTARFRFSDDDLVGQAVEAVERGLTVDEETRWRVVRLTAQGADVRACADAVHALHAALGAGVAAVDAVGAARHALTEHWPAVRRDLFRLVREATVDSRPV
ncbi:DUF6461 domain-containing protein [Micromonospora sp. WMMD1120]|uniref:DUF6461 domain-containing protein n=1 Tax=Micromonospora sp. WMMD1120 TaxID=3016106 RepID=UPI002416253F|nr:DUF6461 domain-containing protein [Micromonospora sp. WMMD1120]MDG4805588.1 DUF6461 domain-containing protein [Micromonospora sp. WMMD1120]